MMIALYILGWIVCMTVAYIILKRNFTSLGLSWTQGDRIVAITLSLAGPFAVLAALIAMLATLSTKLNKPAKW